MACFSSCSDSGRDTAWRVLIKFTVCACALLLFTHAPLLYAPPARVSSDLLVLYQFSGTEGSVVEDIGGVGTPLDLNISDINNVTWLGEGLRIDKPVVIQTTTATSKISSAIKASDELTLEAWVLPMIMTQDGPARIVSYSQNTRRRNVTLGQKNDRYDARLRSSSTNNNGMPSLRTPAGSLTTQLTHVVYTRSSDGNIKIYLDGIEVANDLVSGNLDNWDNGYTLLLANELTGDRPWLGEYFLVALYSKALSVAEVEQNYFAGIYVSPAPPVISNVNVEVQENSAILSWDTDIEASSQVFYGLSSDYEISYVTNFSYITNHQVTLNGLSADTEYHFKIVSTSVNGKVAESTDQLFKTLGGTEPPLIVSQTSDITIEEGGSALFNVSVLGSLPLSFQWYKNSLDIEGATSQSLLLENVSLIDDGSEFYVKVDNLVDTITSMPVSLWVVPLTRVKDDLLALYTFSEGSGSVVQDSSGSGVALDLTIADINSVEWQDGALDIVYPTIISAVNSSQDNSSKIIDAVKQREELTIEAWVTPVNNTQKGPARMVTLSSTPYARNFTFGQDRAGYDVRFRTTDTNKNGRPSLSAANSVFIQPTHVVYTRGADGIASLYVDNQLVSSTTTGGSTSNWDEGFSFALGNEITEDRPWLGRYHLVALYQRALTANEVTKNYQAGPDDAIVVPPPEPNTGYAQLSWSIPSMRQDGSALPVSEIDHYVVIYGEDENLLDKQILIENADTTAYLLENLVSASYYFKIKVVDINGLQSAYSNTVNKVVEN